MQSFTICRLADNIIRMRSFLRRTDQRFVEIADIVRTVVKESCGTTVGLEVVPGDERASSQLCAKRFAEDFAAGGWKSLYESVREICTAELSRK